MALAASVDDKTTGSIGERVRSPPVPGHDLKATAHRESRCYFRQVSSRIQDANVIALHAKMGPVGDGNRFPVCVPSPPSGAANMILVWSRFQGSTALSAARERLLGNWVQRRRRESDRELPLARAVSTWLQSSRLASVPPPGRAGKAPALAADCNGADRVFRQVVVRRDHGLVVTDERSDPLTGHPLQIES